MKVLIIHGAGMDMRGKSQIEVFGPMTLAQYDQTIMQYATELGVSVKTYHSNVESEVVNKLYEAHAGDVDAGIINPAGYANGYPTLVAAIEAHMSNPAARRGSAGMDQVASACRGVVSGFGIFGYYLALRAAIHLVNPP